MHRVQGIGGIFFAAADQEATRAFYRDVLGVPMESWGGAIFPWSEQHGAGEASTTFSVFAGDTSYFAPSSSPFMINFRVVDLDQMLAQVRAAGGWVDSKIEESEFGRFGWVMDPAGNKIELWQPPEAAL